MNAVLPDVSTSELLTDSSPLDWVGMQGIDLPILIDEADYRRTLHARADVQVDLPSPHVKGIHMSRLYRLLDDLGETEPLTPTRVRAQLQAMIDSHSDCESGGARLSLCFNLLTRRSALVTDDLAGWKSYPIRLDASLIDKVFSLRLHATVEYSSTCPCSAALSRQLVEQGFTRAFKDRDHIDTATVASWLRDHATLATPHSQRSEANISVSISEDSSTLGLLTLIDDVEQALATPVQTAVKRADEQAFAALNGQNLMFVEDAARRTQSALRVRYNSPKVHVRHLESLHPHDAVAWASDSAEDDL